MMIKNERQVTITKKKLEELKRSLNHIREKYAGNKKKIEFYSKGVLEHIEQLTKEVVEYDEVRYSAVPEKLHARGLFDIRTQIIKLRIAKGITQAELAKRLHVPQSEISRFEREDYEGYSIKMLVRILKALKTDAEIDLIPAHS